MRDTCHSPHVPLLLREVAIHIVVSSAALLHSVLVFGCPVGALGLSTLENSTSKSAVSVICLGAVHDVCCGALPSVVNIRVDAHSFCSPAGTPSDHPAGTGLLQLPPLGVAGAELLRMNTVDLYDALGLMPASPCTPAAVTCQLRVFVGGTPVMGVCDMQR